MSALDLLRFAPEPGSEPSGILSCHAARERKRSRSEYRDAVLGYRAAIADAEEFSLVRDCPRCVESARRKVKLTEDRRRVERELAS